jgi:hypothetical protein
MASNTREESPAQRELADVLAENKETAERLRTEPVKAGEKPIHRTKLWVYSTGRGKPNVETAAFIERVTDGRVKANGWETDRKVDESEPHGSAA